MEHQDPLNERGEHELRALFRSAAVPAPSAGFAARTMRAVKRQSLPAGRKPLADPLMSLAAWAAVVAGVAISSLMFAMSQPMVTTMFTALVSYTAGAAVWLLPVARTGASVMDVLATAGVAVSRVAATREGMTALVLVAIVGALSLSALHRLLIVEEEKPQWQEAS